MTSQYLRALMQKKMVCKSEEERGQLCDRLLQDAAQLRELFGGLVSAAQGRRGARAEPREGSITHHPHHPLLPPAHKQDEAVIVGSCEVKVGGTCWIRDWRDPPRLAQAGEGKTLGQASPGTRCMGT